MADSFGQKMKNDVHALIGKTLAFHFICHRIDSVPLLPPPTPIWTIGPVQCDLCVRGTLGHGGAGNDSKLSTFSPAAGVFIFGLTLKHKAIHHRAPLRPGLGPAIRRRDTRIRGQGPRHQSRRTLNSAEGILNKLTGDSIKQSCK